VGFGDTGKSARPRSREFLAIGRPQRPRRPMSKASPDPEASNHTRKRSGIAGAPRTDSSQEKPQASPKQRAKRSSQGRRADGR